MAEVSGFEAKQYNTEICIRQTETKGMWWDDIADFIATLQIVNPCGSVHLFQGRS